MGFNNIYHCLDKRHRSSSSLAGVVLEGTFSERKLDIKASIPEVDDYFAVAEARCEDLQEKVNLVKNIKKRLKLKKRSTTRVTDQQMPVENVLFVPTQRKKKVPQQPVRLRPVGTSVKSIRGYVDPTISDQHLITHKNTDVNLERDCPGSYAARGRAYGEVKEENLEGPVVEIGSAQLASGHRKEAKVPDTPPSEETTEPGDCKRMVQRPARRIQYRKLRRYEMPTVASRLKQAGGQSYAPTINATNIPFTIGKSTAQSHNIGANIQQVLNGIKSGQPLSGIPLTIAHHMGLGHISHKTKSVQEVPNNKGMNAIRVGRRLLMLPMFKSISYCQLLNLFRQDDGMVSRFLRGLGRPHNCLNHEDMDGATKQSWNEMQDEFACMCKEYQELEEIFKSNQCKLEDMIRYSNLHKKLQLKKSQIQKVLFGPKKVVGPNLRHFDASPPVADEDYRRSRCKLNAGDTLHFKMEKNL